MSTLQVDRIIPYQSSSVTVEGLSAPNLATTGSNTFVGDQNIQGTITASIQEGFALVGGVGDVSTLVATSSFGSSGNFATTGSNTFNGDQTINGKSTQTFNAPATNTQSDVVVVNGANIDGTAYTNVFFGMQDYPGGGDQFKDAFIFDYWTDFNYATGSEFIVSPKRIGGSMLLSGSAGGVSRTGISQLRDLGGKTFLNQYANLMNIGALESVTTDQILIGNKALTFLRLSSLKNEITGSTFISGSSEFDLTIEGRGLITGPTTGQTPQLLISSSDFNNRIGRSTSYITSPGRTFGSGYGARRLDASADISQNAILNIGVFDEPGFVTDIELLVQVATGSGIEFQDIRNDNYAYTTWMQIEPNTGNNPAVQFKREIEITGSVSITDVIQLAGLDPLPTGGVGQLAVSASNLYYNNGATWTQIN
jgi:hypothetical protein